MLVTAFEPIQTYFNSHFSTELNISNLGLYETKGQLDVDNSL